MRKRRILSGLALAFLFGVVALVVVLYFPWKRMEVLPAEGGEGPLGGSFGVADLVKVGFGYPYFYVRAYAFRGAWTTPEPLFLDGDYELEFTPIVMNVPASRCRLETYLTSGNEEVLLAESRPYSFRATILGRITDSDNRYDVLGHRVRIDLSPYRGRRGSLRWMLKDADSGADLEFTAAIGDPQLIAKDASGGEPAPILFICSDAHRYDYALGEKGQQLMPRLQELGRQAVVYRQAYSDASWTLPSVVSLLTGRLPRFHGTGRRIETGEVEQLRQRPLAPGQFLLDWGEDSAVLTAYPRQLTTLGERLQEQGYTTAMVLSNPLYLLSGLYADGQDVIIDTTVVPGEEVNRSVFELLEQLAGRRPLFLLVHYMDTHHFTQWYFEPAHPGKTPREAKEEWIAAYEQAVQETDRNLGELLDRWDAKVGLERSLVVFFADHGEHLLDRGREARGHGNSMDEVLLHVPLVVKFPRGIQQSPDKVDSAVSLSDLGRTALALVSGSTETESFPGRSLLDLSREADSPPRYLFADYQLYGDELSCVREGPWKLVLNLDNQEKRLFDTRLPEGERGEFDRLTIRPVIQHLLESAFIEYASAAARVTAGLAAEQTVDPQKAVESLRALGYAR